MFFAQFFTWLNGELVTYISTMTARVAAALEPAAIAAATVYVMLWGWLHLRGSIEQPVMEGLRRILLLAIVIGVGLRLWAYHDVIVALFFDGPRELAAAVLGAGDPVATVDAIWAQGGAVGDALWERGGVFSGDIGYYLAGLAVWGLVGALCVYVAFLLALSQIALAVLLALGPFFIVMLLFEQTKRFFEQWLAQLANYGFIAILTLLLSALLLQFVASYARQVAARGDALVTVDALNLLLAVTLVLLVLRQVLPMAAGLARGVGLQTFGAVGSTARAMVNASRNTARAGYEYAAGWR